MIHSFEKEKNRKASLYTAGVLLLLLLLVFLYSWKIPREPQPLMEEGMEVNLGNSETGYGEVQPLIPGTPAASDASKAAPSASNSPSNEEDLLKDEKDEEAPVINRKEEKKPVTPKTPVTTPAKTVVKTNPSPAPVPAPPKPKALYKGGNNNGSGGNNADDYNNSRNQGIAGGRGDQGNPNGNPNSDSYTGTGGNGRGGPKILRGDRKIIKYYSFTGDLPPATINAQIRVSPEGRGTYIKIEKGSTSTERAYGSAIADYLKNMAFDKSDHESYVVVQFIFKTQ